MQNLLLHPKPTMEPILVGREHDIDAIFSETDPVPTIDLYNFDEPQFEESKYVITSPRSLEACSRLDIKPIELLYKALSEFQDDLAPRGIPLTTVYQIYEEHERERQNKLEMCREERKAVVLEEAEVAELRRSALITIPQRESSGRLYIEDLEDEITLEKQRMKDEATLQRERTAWTTGIGHDRVTPDELQSRAEALFEEGRRLQEQIVKGTKPVRGKRKKKVQPKGLVRAKKAGNSGSKQPTKPQIKKKQQRARRGSFGGSDKTPSVSELSVGSSRASRWSRDPTADAKPISNPALKNKLGATGTSGAKVTSKDQKILELMLAKREEAKKVTQKREAARSAWEEEKQREAQARSSAENARRRTLSEHRRLQENRRAAEAHARLSRGDEVSQSMDALNRKLRDDEDSRNDGEESLKFSVTQWSARCNRIMAEKEAKLAEKRRQNMERKKSAEERLQAKLREEKERNNALLERQERQLRRASSLKESKEAEQVMQRRTKSAQYKKKQEENKSAIERRSREDLSNLKSHIDSKLNFAGDVTKIQQQRKTKDLRKSMYELDARLEKSRENQQRMEEELGVWRDDLKSYRKMMDQKAEEQARQNVLNKKKKAMQERIAKERAQKENMKKLMQQEEEWKMDVEATLAMKDARARVIQMEKEEMIEESRKMAHASQRLREELRNAYSSDHIDQLSRRAELEAKIIGNPIPHTTKNMSNLNLG